MSQLPPHQKAVIFDLGNVLVHVNNSKALPHFQKYLKKAVSYEQLEFVVYGGMFKGGLAEIGQVHVDFHLGKLTPQSFYQQIMATGIFANTLTYELFNEYWSKPRFTKNKLVFQLLKQLHAHRRYLLSDTNPTDYAWLRFRFPKLFVEFDQEFISFKTKTLKFDASCWHGIFAHSGLAPHDHVFIDDRSDHVQRAKTIGMQGIVFENAKQVKNELVKLGFL